MSVFSEIGRSFAAVAGVAAVCVVGSGCASPGAGGGGGGEGSGVFEVASAARGGAGVFADGETRGFYAARGSLSFERFAYSRNDGRVTARRAAPLTAGGQWPEPPRPLERRIILEHWDQD
jgi:hypothetical protein